MIIQLAASVLIAFLPTNVDVSPDDSDPIIKLKAERRDHGQFVSTRSRPRVKTTTTRTPPPPSIADGCFYDLSVTNWRCGPAPTTPEPTTNPTNPEPTPADILTATQQLPLPTSTLSIQPTGGTTLVNLPTILHTTSPTFDHTITLAGYTVTIHATPTTYTWHHGDNTTQTTTTPGKPYPDHTITHTYTQPASHLTPRVDTTYTITYRINNGPWRTLAQTITATGPTTTLTIREATPILTNG